MAFTSDSVEVRPITVVGPRNSVLGKPVVRQYRVNVSQTIIKGDLCILSSGKVTKAADICLGVAASDKTTGASVDEDDIIQVYDAAANFFEANLVTSETVDEDMVDRSNWHAGRPLAFANVAPASTAGQWAILETAAAANDDAIIIDLARRQVQFDIKSPTITGLPGSGAGIDSEGSGTFTDVKVGDKIPRAGAHTGILNPRVIFVFKSVQAELGSPLIS